MDAKNRDDRRGLAASRRAVVAALASAPVIITLVPGRARAEYDPDGVYHANASVICTAPPDDNPGGQTGGKNECQQWDTVTAGGGDSG